MSESTSVYTSSTSHESPDSHVREQANVEPVSEVDPAPNLNEFHKGICRERGISMRVAHAAGLRSHEARDKDEDEYRKKLGLSRLADDVDEIEGAPLYPVNGLFIPYQRNRETRQEYWRIRYDSTTFVARTVDGAGMDDSERRDCPRYQCKGGVPVQPYIPGALPGKLAQDVFNVGGPFYFTEAPLKCLSLYSHGYPGVGLGGVLAGAHLKQLDKTKGIVAHPELTRLRLQGRVCYTVFDAGQTRNPLVALGVAYLWKALQSLGAVMRTVTVPEVERPRDGKLESRDQGPDDFLVRHGKEKFQELVNAAYLTDPLERVKEGAAIEHVGARQTALFELCNNLVFRACLSLLSRAEVGMLAAASKRILTQKILWDTVTAFRTTMRPANDVEKEEGWKGGLSRYSSGLPRNIGQNVELCLREDPELQGMLAYDEFASIATFKKIPPWAKDYPGAQTKEGSWWQDDDLTRLGHHLGRTHHILDVPSKKLDAVVRAVARDHAYHPVRDYLEGLVWDGFPRLHDWLTTHLRCPVSEHASLVGRWFLIQAVARVMEPGCRAQYMLVLEGGQGINKSTALRVLGGDWFSDGDLGDLKNKESALQLQGKWIIECGEAEILHRASARAIKAFSSREFDDIILKYSNVPTRLLRQCVFCITLNEDSDYLSDETGNRRYWSIRCLGQIDIDNLRRVRDQLWAEAVAAYKSKASGAPLAEWKWWPSPAEESRLMAPEAKERLIQDPWYGTVRNYLARHLASEYPNRVTVLQVLLDIEPEIKKHTQRERGRVTGILRQLGWEQLERNKSVKFWQPGLDNVVQPGAGSIGIDEV